MTCNDCVHYDTCGIKGANACFQFEFNEEFYREREIYNNEEEMGNND